MLIYKYEKFEPTTTCSGNVRCFYVFLVLLLHKYNKLAERALKFWIKLRPLTVQFKAQQQ